MATPYGNLESHISALINSVSELNSPKISDTVSDMYNTFLQMIKSIAKTVNEIQKDMINAKPKKREKFTPIIDSVIYSLKITVSRLIEKIEKIVEKSRAKKYDEISTEKKFLNSIANQLRSTGEINPDLLSKINTTQNHALDRYLISILSSQTRSKYPWTYYVPTITDLKDRLMDVYTNNKNPDEIKDKYVHNFLIMMKQIYYMTKTNVRNISMIRLADLTDSSDRFLKYKNILEKLLFTRVEDEFIPGDYNSMKSTYSSHTNNLSKLLGGDNYKRLVYHVINDGQSFKDKDGNSTKIVKTETLIKYIIIAIEKINSSNVDQYNKFYDTIVSFVEKVLETNANIADLSSIVELSDAEFNRSDLSAKHNRENNIFTFVKIRADKVGSLVETNQRYRTGLDRERQIMYMGYESAPENIYDDTLSLKNEYQYLASEENPMPNNYIFGPFSYIFKPSDDNGVISNHKSMSPLLEKIKNGKSVCVIGYGASGSGKTTALVYAGFENTQDKRNGILIHFCNILRDYYGEIEVSFLELEGNINEDENDVIKNFKILPIPDGEEKELNEDKTFKYTDEDKHRQTYYNGRTFSIDHESNEWVLSEDSGLDPVNGTTLNKGIDIGKYIVTIMDNKRSVKATTNNPVSSRSHMIIFVKFKNKKSEVAQEKEPYLIICDFAGVENKFQCNNEEVLSMFENIKSQTKCKDPNLSKNQCKEFEPFYDVQSKVRERLNSEDATYTPEHFTVIGVPESFKRATLFSIFPDNDKQRDIFSHIAFQLDIIISEAYNTNKVQLLIDAIQKLYSVVTTPEYPKLKLFISCFSNPDPDVEKWLKDLYNQFNISKDEKPFNKKKIVDGVNIERVVPKFVYDMYIHKLREDDYNKIYISVKKSLPAGRAMTSAVINNVLKKSQSTISSPLLSHITQYINLCTKELEGQDKANKNIAKKIQKKKDTISGVKEFRKQMLSQICNDRVKEGLFINNSLLDLRSFISHFVTGIQNNGDGKITNPKFIDECAPLQCNPNFENCFGSTTVLNKNLNESSVIANEIRKRLCCVDRDGKNKIGCKSTITCEDFKDITFCIFNVINLTKKSNNPPPIPHIDLTDLMMELNRLESVKTMLVMDEYKISDDMTAPYVHPIYLDEIKNSKLLDESMLGSLKGNDKKIIIDTISILEKYHNIPEGVNQTINALKLLIDIINTTNSLSLIGTLEFTDMISKFGLNRTTCNYKYKGAETSKLKGKELQEFKTNVSEYKSFILNLHSKYNDPIVDV